MQQKSFQHKKLSPFSYRALQIVKLTCLKFFKLMRYIHKLCDVEAPYIKGYRGKPGHMVRNVPCYKFTLNKTLVYGVMCLLYGAAT